MIMLLIAETVEVINLGINIYGDVKIKLVLSNFALKLDLDEQRN
jgi:hypothetical protein